MRKLFFGLESGSQATLDHMDKGIRVDDAKLVLRNCSDAGIAFHLFSIVGFPEENEGRARETAQFFVDNAEVIDHPRNTFDIHPFSLDLRTDYAEQAASFGVDIDLEDLAGRDFPITAMRWRNGHGLDQPGVDQLLEEFHAQLRHTYRTYHQYPLFVWPGYEEYTVLYGDYYESRAFPFRISLPAAHDDTPIRLVWTEQARIKATDDGYIVSGPFATARVSANALALLAQPGEPAAVDDLLVALAAPFLERVRAREIAVNELRTVIDWLLGTGALQLVSMVAEPVAQ
jgi:anaerobic magnesium-protoporphyrin IX monomethyl ester cyclase